MKILKQHFFSLFSGLVVAYSIINVNYVIIWFALVPFFYSIKKLNLNQTLQVSFTFAFILNFAYNFWMIDTIVYYFQTTELIAIFFPILFSIYYSILFILFIFLFKYLEFKDSTKNNIIYNSILISLLFFVFEITKGSFFREIFWDKYFLGICLAENDYLIQIVEIIGAYGLTLFIVCTNYILTEYIFKRNIKYLFLSSFPIIVLFLFGFNSYKNKIDYNNSKLSKKISIICQNVDPFLKWSINGNNIINSTLNNLEYSKKYNPSLVVWSETSFPWSYKSYDDIIMEINKIYDNKFTQNIFGYLTLDTINHQVLTYNSAYLINNKSEVIGRYDKKQPVLFSEKFYDFFRFGVKQNSISNGKKNHFLKTNIGNSWVMICSESVLTYYFEMPNTNPDFIINMSNDAWFQDNQNVRHHHLMNKLKAIELRKYLISNSNYGFCGIIDKYGNEIDIIKSRELKILNTKIIPNKEKTFFFRYSYFLPILSFTIILLISFKKFYIIINNRIKL